MRRLLFLLICFSITSILCCSEIKNDLTNDNLKGKIKQRSITYYNIKDNKKTFIEKKVYYYDIDGFYSKIEYYSIKGKLRYTKKYYYDENYRITKIESIHSTSFVENIKTKYDKNHNLIEEYNETLNLKVIYRYDLNGNQIEMISYDSNGSICSSIRTTYDNNNREKYKTVYLSNELFLYKKEFIYNLTGEIEKVITYDHKNNVVNIHIFEYEYGNDDNIKIVKEYELNNNKNILLNIENYDYVKY